MKLLEKEFTHTLSSENVIMVINTKCWECAVQTGNHFLFNNYNHLQRGTGGVQDPSNEEKYMYVQHVILVGTMRNFQNSRLIWIKKSNNESIIIVTGWTTANNLILTNFKWCIRTKLLKFFHNYISLNECKLFKITGQLKSITFHETKCLH